MKRKKFFCIIVLTTFILYSILLTGCFKSAKKGTRDKTQLIGIDEFLVLKSSEVEVEVSGFKIGKSSAVEVNVVKSIVKDNKFVVEKIDFKDIISNVVEETVYEIKKGSIVAKKTIKKSKPNIMVVLVIFLIAGIVVIVCFVIWIKRKSNE